MFYPKIINRKEFTIAEVLITMVVVGVVVAITVPSLMFTTQKKENVARYKKLYL